MPDFIDTYIAAYKKSHPTRNIAGYLDGDDNFIWVDRPRASILPAAAYLADYIVRKGWSLRNSTIYTSLPTGHWITTYFKNIKTVGMAGGATYKKVNPKSLDETAGELKLNLFSGFDQFAAPIPGGGLYEAAEQGLALSPEKQALLTGSRRARVRALRYYMLATYALLGLCKRNGYEGGNYVAAMMVSDDGQVLSFGVNNGQSAGSFHHAEVNMLLSYFDANRDAVRYPEKTVVFSTLTPCAQCTAYLKDTRPAKSFIYFGQMDTGKSGAVGAEGGFSKAFDELTKPVRGSELNEGVVNKFRISTGIESCMTGGGMIAAQIGLDEPAAYLETALSALERKSEKARSGETAEQKEEGEIKTRVLDYLRAFVNSTWA
jgi:tRNA(Arg) A34 adenosine deaminase TadA